MRTTLILTLLFAAGLLPAQTKVYFQQEVNYTLSVSLNDREHSLSGFAAIQYINHSPDRLEYLYFHCWPNAYKNNTTAFARQELENGSTRFYFAPEEERGFMDSLSFRVDDRPVSFLPDSSHLDIARLILNAPLLPGDTITITTPFYVKIPGSFSRLGHKGQAYQISQWYPKPAVYDREGWHPMPYLDQGEFYSEFGSFEVTITLPRNYVVGATGNLMTESEQQWLEQKAEDTTVPDDLPASDSVLKTIRYEENNIHDFAWFADKRYRVMKGEVVLSGNHKVLTWAMYPDAQADLWKNATAYIHDAIRYYSDWYGNYPYQTCTAVYGALEAGGAMEYPTITVVGNAGTPTMLEDYIMHEVGHNWFYGILGFNERKYPYLDEGLNTFSEFRYMRAKYPQLKLYQMMLNQPKLAGMLNLEDIPHGELYNKGYLLSARSNQDQPLNLSSEQYSLMNYGTMIYYKSALAFTYLMNYLGEPRFDSIMQQFLRDWQFKHPDPAALHRAFQDHCAEDLSWFFEDLLTTRKRLDYVIRRIKPDSILIRNSGQIPAPLSITTFQQGNPRQQWVAGFTGKKWLPAPAQESGAKLFAGVWPPEINQKNNIRRKQGPLGWIEPLHIRPVQLLEKPDKTSVGILPALGWNNYNKTMLGVLLYSPLIPQQTFEYQVLPLYGLGNQDIAGMARVSLNLYPYNGLIQAIQLTLDARRFGYDAFGTSYNRLRGEMLLTFRNADARSPLRKYLKLGMTTASVLGYPSAEGFLETYYLTADANIASSHALGPYSLNLNAEKSNNYWRTTLEAHYARTLRYARNALQLRLYASAFPSRENDFNDFYAIRLSGSAGIHDYRYEQLYLGRSEYITDANRQIFLSQQFVMNEGGFASNNPYAFSDKWMITAGFKVRVPRIPVYWFIHAGTYAGAGDTVWDISPEESIQSAQVAYETGAMVDLGGMVRIYFPVYASRDITAVNDALLENYWQTIRYSIDFNGINPFKLKNRIF
jgi:hypothetical protein